MTATEKLIGEIRTLSPSRVDNVLAYVHRLKREETGEAERNDDSQDEGDSPILQLFGCHKGIPGASVDDFLARCREDKERELAREERQFQERRARYAKLSS